MPMTRDDSGINVLKRRPGRRQVQSKHLDRATVKVRVLQKDRVPMPPATLT